MQGKQIKTVVVLLVTVGVLLAAPPARAGETVKTRIGELAFTHDFENGYPTDETVKKLYDEMDFQRACQAYLWGLPVVSIAQWQHAHQEVFGAGDGDFVIYTSYIDKQGILTANMTTPYVFAFANMANTGPLVLELQPGLNASGIGTFWQRSVADVGAMGPDQCKGGKYLILPPGSDMPDVEGYFMAHTPTQNLFLGIRSLEADIEKGMAWIRSLQMYPYAQRDNPPKTKFIDAGDRKWSHMQPRGMAYWQRLADIINNEVVQEHDRVTMATLKYLGIEKGKPFNPTPRQQKILEEAALVGEAMAKANTYDKRFDDVLYRPETHWKYVMVWHWTHETEHYHQLDEMAAYTYEAVGTSRGMITQTPGVGQAFLSAYKDADGDWLDGAQAYRLHVPPNPPMKQFWSVTVYDVDTRCPIDNEQQIADRSSRMPDVVTNGDGSVDLYFGPKAPKGKEKNWIPTAPGKGWFTYFRLYAPTEPYLDRTWKLPDIEKIEVGEQTMGANGPVAVVQSWQGDLPVDQLRRLPRGQRETSAGWIGNPRRFNAVWQAFQPDQDVPEVDFDKHIVVFARNTQFYNRTNIFKVELKDGVAAVLAMETMSAHPIEEKVAMAMAVIPRAGVKAIKSNGGNIPVSDVR